MSGSPAACGRYISSPTLALSFEGAWLVQNFEALRPEGVWKKDETLWVHPERERDPFLEFERWWNGFYFLGHEEIHCDRQRAIHR